MELQFQTTLMKRIQKIQNLLLQIIVTVKHPKMQKEGKMENYLYVAGSSIKRNQKLSTNYGLQKNKRDQKNYWLSILQNKQKWKGLERQPGHLEIELLFKYRVVFKNILLSFRKLAFQFQGELTTSLNTAVTERYTILLILQYLENRNKQQMFIILEWPPSSKKQQISLSIIHFFCISYSSSLHE